MISIERAVLHDVPLLSTIGKVSFIASHGSSATEDVINSYVAEKYTHAIFETELNDPCNIYYIIYYNGMPAGYSKIIFNAPCSQSLLVNLTKLERLYLLPEFYDLKLGHELLLHNIALSKVNGQAGMWLFVWKGNSRAVRFYEKEGFKVIGSYDFRISDTHYNPNHQLLLAY